MACPPARLLSSSKTLKFLLDLGLGGLAVFSLGIQRIIEVSARFFKVWNTRSQIVAHFDNLLQNSITQAPGVVRCGPYPQSGLAWIFAANFR